MATSQATADFILEQISAAGPVSARKMFGEYGVYCAGKIVALICDEQLYVKPTVAGRAQAGRMMPDGLREGSPYPNAKPHLLIPGEFWDDADALSALIRITAGELPSPAPKKKRK